MSKSYSSGFPFIITYIHPNQKQWKWKRISSSEETKGFNLGPNKIFICFYYLYVQNYYQRGQSMSALWFLSTRVQVCQIPLFSISPVIVVGCLLCLWKLILSLMTKISSRVPSPFDPYWHPPLHSYSGEVNNGVLLSHPPTCKRKLL